MSSIVQLSDFSQQQIPQRLLGKKFSPSQIFALGDISLLEKLSIAIVGSRDACDQTLLFTQKLASQCAQMGLVVVSGGARGVDCAAHQGALNIKNGQTIAVLGTSLHKSFAHHQKDLMNRIVEQKGLIVSEIKEDEPYLPRHFIERNRIIAGLAHIVVIVRAKMDSGALSTAQWAKRWNRCLWAVPGAPWDERAMGVNQLILEGHSLLLSIEQFKKEIEDTLLNRHQKLKQNPNDNKNLKDPILSQLQSGSKSLDELMLLQNLKNQEISQTLLSFQLQGLITLTQDGRYALL